VAVREGLAGSLTTTEDDLRRLIERAMPGIRPATSQTLAETARVRTVAHDDTIFQQGEVVPLALIVRGYGAFRRTTVDGRPLTVGIANPGELYGLTSIASVISSVDMVALTECDAAIWTGTEVRELVAADPRFALDVIDRMASFLNILTEKVDGFLHQDSRRRVVRVLARHRDLFFAEPAILSRSHLPSLVGTSREMTGRVLRELEREGVLLRVGLTGLRLLRPDQLDADAAGNTRDAG
jgi:CRP/FNR family cyclic AMP-dependent transcriptional regulator